MNTARPCFSSAGVVTRDTSVLSLCPAQADLKQMAANLRRLQPADDKESGISAVSLGQHVVAGARVTKLAFRSMARAGRVHSRVSAGTVDSHSGH